MYSKVNKMLLRQWNDAIQTFRKKAEHIQSLSSDLLIHALRQNERAFKADTSGENKKEMRRREGAEKERWRERAIWRKQ